MIVLMMGRQVEGADLERKHQLAVGLHTNKFYRDNEIFRHKRLRLHRSLSCRVNAIFYL